MEPRQLETAFFPKSRLHPETSLVCLENTHNARMRELYRIVREAADACIAEIRAGVPAIAPHRAAKSVIADAGLDEYRLHTTGYGLAPGFPPTWAESLQLFDDSEYTLEAGMVVSVEPGIFIHEERLGARVIDNILVTETGSEILSTLTRDIIIVG